LALYHFHVHDGYELPDREGHELPDLAAARRFAVMLGGELIRDHADAFWEHRDWRMDVTDADGLMLFALHFSAVEAPAVRRVEAAQK